MKRIFTTIIGFALSTSLMAQINTFPYQESFDANDGGWVASGTVSNWEYGQPANAIIDNGSGCTGQNNAWVTGLTVDYLNNADSYLESPVFDMSGLTADPVIRFDMIFDNESCCDESWMEISIDGGTTWSKLGTSGTGANWYNDAGNQWWDSNIASWTGTQNILTGASGQSDVRLRFVFMSDGSATNEGVGVDNIYVGDANFVDLAIVELLSPTSGSNLSVNEPIIIVITNNGGGTASFTDYAICMNGDLPQACESTVIDIVGGSTDTITLLSTADLSTIGMYGLNFYISMLTPDLTQCNDTMNFSVSNAPLINAFPYIEDFESGTGFWIASGTGNWEHGVPSNTIISSATGCGDKAWVTGLSTEYINNAQAYLTSPEMDLSGFSADPNISFDYIYDNESCCDETNLEYSLDAGTTWNNFNLWDANTSGWENYQAVLTGLAGQSSVMLRFVKTSDGSVTNEGFGIDNIMVYDVIAEANVLSLVSPVSGCGMTNAENVSIEISNNGTSDITSIDVCYSLNGGALVCETVTTTIVGGGTYTHTFAGTIDMSVAGSYSFGVTNTLTGDVNICNDSTGFNIFSVETVVTYPYIQDYEGGQAGWTINSNNVSTWAFGTPAMSVINSAASGVNAFATGNLNGTYSNNEDGWVESPCFDFTNLCAPQIEMDIWYECENSWDGANLQFSVDYGVTWQNVGLLADPFNYNWYNDGTINGNPGGSQEGWTGQGSNGWITARHALDTLGGYSNVKLRVPFGSDGSVQYDGFAFDNVKVYDGVYRDDRTVAICPGDSALLIGLGYAGTADTWAWSTGETNDSIYVTTPGVYTYDLVTGGCSFMDSLEAITVDTLGMETLGADTSSCGSLVVGPASVANTTYLWNTTETTQMVTADTSGLYIVIATNACATKTDSIDVAILVPVSVDLGADTLVCANMLPLTLDAGAGFTTYLWSDASGNQTLDVSATGSYAATVTGANGCEATDTVTVTVDPCTSIEELSVSNVSVYPNPSAGVFTVEYDGNVSNVQLSILDLNGKVVYSETMNTNKTNIELNTIANGVYTVVLVSNDTVSTTKMVVTK